MSDEDRPISPAEPFRRPRCEECYFWDARSAECRKNPPPWQPAPPDGWCAEHQEFADYMPDHTESQIPVAIIPAEGVVAVFKDGGQYPVVCWVITEIRRGDRRQLTWIVGAIVVEGRADLSLIVEDDETTGFSHYEFQP